MPEIWLNYGITDVVLDIRSEIIEDQISVGGSTLDDQNITERLSPLDLSRELDLVVLNNSPFVHQVITSIFKQCETESKPFPHIFADNSISNIVQDGLPQGSKVEQFKSDQLDSDLVFISEIEFDGLFGFETIATRLLKQFGDDLMLDAYTKRSSDVPAAGQLTSSIQVAKDFANKFEIQGIELFTNSNGISDIMVDHPSNLDLKPLNPTKSLGQHPVVIASTGRYTSNNTLQRSLASLWNCTKSVKKDGFIVMIAECKEGLGSAALQRYIEGRLDIDQISNPSEYISGLEDLLFLSNIKRDLNIGMLSVLPEFYVKRLDIVPLSSARHTMQYLLDNYKKDKLIVIPDAARLVTV